MMDDNSSDDEDAAMDNLEEVLMDLGALPALPPAGEEGDSEAEQFDISLPATHSYMGPTMTPVRSAAVVYAGWRGNLPAVTRAQPLFVGEALPLVLLPSHSELLLRHEHTFALLFADESGLQLSGAGVVCETSAMSPRDSYGRVQLTARAVLPLRAHAAAHTPLFDRPRVVHVQVLGERACTDWLQHVRPPSSRARGAAGGQRALMARRMDAAVTNVPAFLFDVFDYDRLSSSVRSHLLTLGLTSVPEQPLPLSVFAARHIPGNTHKLWEANGALPRLWLSLHRLRQSRDTVLCCAACGRGVARHNHMFAMSSDGAHAHYANPGGYTHDIITVRTVRGVMAAGGASSEYSWFPGYSWTVLTCGTCHTHLGWKFEALKPTLRPTHFYGLCRNYVTPLRNRPDTSPDVSNDTSPHPDTPPLPDTPGTPPMI